MAEVEPASPKRPAWRSARVLLYVLAIAFFAIVLWRSRFWDSGDALESVGAEYFLAIPLLSLVFAPPLAVRGRTLLAALGHRVPALSLAPLAYFGNTVGFMTPAASGEALRPSLLRRTFGVPIAQGIGAVLFERLFSFYFVGLSCLLALSWTNEAPGWVGPVALPLLLISTLVPSAAAAAAPGIGRVLPVERLARVLPHGLRENLEESAETLRKLWLSGLVVAVFIILSAFMFLVMAVQFWLIPDALGQNLSLQEAYVVLTVSTIAGFLSGLPLGLGATDAVMLSLLRAYGVDATEAGQIVILNRVLINLPAGLFGLVAYLIAIRQKPAETASPQASRLATVSAGERE